jgi:hypothetical protein
MENFKNIIKAETITAMKAKDQLRVETLRSITTALVNSEKSISNKVVTHIEVLTTLAKQRKQSIEQFENAGYIDDANKEKAELAIIEEFLPKSLSDDDLKVNLIKVMSTLSENMTIKDMGKIVGAFKNEYPGQDMGKISGMIKEIFA